MTVDPSVCRILCEHVDWDDAKLRQTVAAQAWRDGDLIAASLELVRHMRTTPRLGLGLPASLIARLRHEATDEDRAAAELAWSKTMQRDLFTPAHSNAFAALGAERMALVATPERCRKAARRVLARRADWESYPYCFGSTHGICRMLNHLWTLPECEDECLIPVLAWLVLESGAEWRRMQSLEAVLGPSGHNWYAHSFHGFFMAGCWFSELGFARFRDMGWSYLRRELPLLFEADGWSKEGATGYHLFAMHNLHEMAHLAEINGMPVGPEAQQQLRTIADTVWRLLAPDATCPGFGDDSRGGMPTDAALSNPAARFTTMLRISAARDHLAQAKHVAEALDPAWRAPFASMLPHAGQDWMPAYQALKAQAPEELDTRLPQSGLYVMRQDWSPASDYLAVLAGPLGQVVSSHKHADIFTFELYSRGRRLLVDNGYGSEVPESRQDKRFRMWRLSSAAHNVATVDGQDHVPIKAEYRYANCVNPLVEQWTTTPNFAYFSGLHEGYRHLPDEVPVCRRKLFYCRGRYWIVIDRFTPANEAVHQYAQHFHLASDCRVDGRGRVTTSGAGGNLMIVPVPTVDGEPTLEPNPFPIQGYENPRHLSYTRRIGGPWLFVTLLVPFLNDAIPQVDVRVVPVKCDQRIANTWETTALEIHINDHRDFHLDHHMHWSMPWQCGSFEGNDRLFHQTSVGRSLP